MDWIAYPLGDLFLWTFGILEFFGNMAVNPNVIFIVIGFLGLFYWLNEQRKYNKAAAENPNQLK
ncbi:MAG: hypothetical protein ACOZCO_02490 [Bacteroidota bacterium]